LTTIDVNDDLRGQDLTLFPLDLRTNAAEATNRE